MNLKDNHRFRGDRSSVFYWCWGLASALILVAGVFSWTTFREPYSRDWFVLHSEKGGEVEGVVVRPKSENPVATVVFVYGSGGSVGNSGRYVRQLAETGLAVVLVEWDAEENQEVFDSQMLALQDFVIEKDWFEKEATAWVGFSRGAVQTGSFLERYPELGPRFYARIGGPKFTYNEWSGASVIEKWLVVHAERDLAFPVADVAKGVEDLREKGAEVDFLIMPETNHNFGNRREMVFRIVGESIRNYFGSDDLPLGFAKRKGFPLIFTVLPGVLLGLILLGLHCRNIKDKAEKKRSSAAGGVAERAGIRGVLWFLSGLMVLSASARVGLQVGVPLLEVTNRRVSIARNWLVLDNWKKEFNLLSTKSFWEGRHLMQTLLTHAELAQYTVYELVNWEVSRTDFEAYVLSPIIDGSDRSAGAELNWRRSLWEHFYPRIRSEENVRKAAEQILYFLRERVTLVEKTVPEGIETIWENQVANRYGFERIYVAALRSVGIPARLDADGFAEISLGEEGWERTESATDIFITELDEEW